MKAYMDADGLITICSENETEKFALKQWWRKNRVSGKYLAIDLTSYDHDKTYREFTALMVKEAEEFQKFRESGKALTFEEVSDGVLTIR